MLARPSRSYADVQHDPKGISGVGNGPYRRQESFKTYRPPLSETHLKRTLVHDPHPTSSFSTLPGLIPHKLRKEQIAAGQRAEVDHLLSPAYRSSGTSILEDDSSTHSGPSRKSAMRTAGGLGGLSKRKESSLKHSASISSFTQPLHSTGSGGLSKAGIYIDSSGKAHDTEFDPFAGVSKLDRRKSRTAFGADRRRSSSSSSSSSVSDAPRPAKVSMDGDEQDEIRRRLDMDRKRLDEVSGYAAARRRSMMSDRSSNRTPSILSDDRSRSQMGNYIPSPLSPTFNDKPSSPSLPSTAEHDSEEKETQMVSPLHQARLAPPAQIKIERAGGTTKITGFDAPTTPVLPHDSGSSSTHLHPSPLNNINGRNSPAPRRSTESARRAKPAERPRDQSFPETPAQIKKREEREKRAGRPSGLVVNTNGSSQAIRVLPEIEIVEDDDPRIIFPTNGPATRVQTVHDHVIKGPFSLALHSQSQYQSQSQYGDSPTHRPSSTRSYDLAGASTNKAPSTIIDEGPGGYLPSRWASGDRKLRLTEGEKEQYRPREWGGKTGELGGRPEEWKPDVKEAVKKQWKELATATRFSLFRTKKKLSRKVEM